MGRYLQARTLRGADIWVNAEEIAVVWQPEAPGAPARAQLRSGAVVETHERLLPLACRESAPAYVASEDLADLTAELAGLRAARRAAAARDRALEAALLRALDARDLAVWFDPAGGRVARRAPGRWARLGRAAADPAALAWAAALPGLLRCNADMLGALEPDPRVDALAAALEPPRERMRVYAFTGSESED